MPLLQWLLPTPGDTSGAREMLAQDQTGEGTGIREMAAQEGEEDAEGVGWGKTVPLSRRFGRVLTFAGLTSSGEASRTRSSARPQPLCASARLESISLHYSNLCAERQGVRCKRFTLASACLYFPLAVTLENVTIHFGWSPGLSSRCV